MMNGKIKILWDDESIRRHRLDGTEYGKHLELIKRIHLEAYKKEDEVKKNRTKYRSSGKLIKPHKRKASTLGRWT